MLCSLAGEGYAATRCIEEGCNVYVKLFFFFNFFVSRSGRRILVAQERMSSLGYTSLRLYRSTVSTYMEC